MAKKKNNLPTYAEYKNQNPTIGNSNLQTFESYQKQQQTEEKKRQTTSSLWKDVYKAQRQKDAEKARRNYATLVAGNKLYSSLDELKRQNGHTLPAQIRGVEALQGKPLTNGQKLNAYLESVGKKPSAAKNIQQLPKDSAVVRSGDEIRAAQRENVQKQYEDFQKRIKAMSPAEKYAMLPDEKKSSYMNPSTSKELKQILSADEAQRYVNENNLYDIGGVRKDLEEWRGKLTDAQQRAEQEKQDIEAKRQGVDMEQVKQDLWDVKGELGVFSQLDAQGLNVSFRDQYGNWHNDETYTKRPDDYYDGNNREDYDALLYDKIYGEGAYEKRVDELETDEQVTALEAKMDELWSRLESKTLGKMARFEYEKNYKADDLEALTTGYTTERTAAEKEARYAQDQIDKLEAQEKWLTQLDEIMNRNPNPVAVGYIEANDRGREKPYTMMDAIDGGIKTDDVHRIYSFINRGKEFKAWAAYQDVPRATDEYSCSMMMNDAMKKRFNDYYNNGQYAEAQQFIKALQPYLRQIYQDNFENINLQETAHILPLSSTVAARGMQAVDTVLAPAGIVAHAFGDKSTEDPTSGWYKTVREREVLEQTVADDLGKYGKTYLVGVNSIRNVINGLMTKGFGLAGGWQTAASLMTFASQIYQESTYKYLKETRDYGKTQGLAALDAIMETAEELLPYEAMLGDSTRPIMYFVKNSLSEAGEEFTGATVGTFVKGLITGRNDVEKRADQIYNEGGYYDKNGKWVTIDKTNKKNAINLADMQALREWEDEVKENTIAGAAGGGLGSLYGGISSLSDTYSRGRNVNSQSLNAEGKSGAQRIYELAMSMGEDTESRKMAEKIKATEGENVKVGNFRMGKLAQTLAQETGEQYGQTVKDTVAQDVEEKLKAAGVSGPKAEQYREIITESVVDGEMTKQELRTLARDEKAIEVWKQYNVDTEENAKLRYDIKEKTKRQESALKEIGELTAKQSESKAEMPEEAKETADAGMHLATEEDRMNAEGEAVQGARGVIFNGKNAKLDGVRVEKAADGLLHARAVVTVDGTQKTVDTSDLQANSYNTAQIVRQAAVNPEFYSEGFTNELLQAEEEGQIKDIGETLNEAKTIRLYAYSGMALPTTNLDYELASKLWKQSAQEHSDNRKAQTAEGNVKADSRITYDGTEYGTKEYNEKVKKLGRNIRNQMDAIAGIAQRAGIEVDFVDLDDAKTYGWENKKGVGINISGMDFGIVDGKAQATGRHNMVVTFGHEMTHWLQRNSAAGYTRLEQYVMKEYMGKGTQQLMQRLNRHMNDGLSLEDAMSEVVADSCDQILTDEETIRHIEETDSKLYSAVKGFVENLVERVKQAITKQEAMQSASRDARWMIANGVNQIGKLWTGALDEALSSIQREAETKPAEGETSAALESVERWTEEMDSEYMQAVEDGNTRRQQELVEEAAKAAGYTEKVYHGTTDFGFTEFDMEKGYGAIFASYDFGQAQTYTNDAEIRKVNEKESEKKDGVYALFAKKGKQLVIDARNNLWSGINLEKSKLLEGVQRYVRANMAEDHDLMFDRTLMANPGPDIYFTTREIAAYAKEAGYDSLRINNVMDDGGLTGSPLSAIGDVGVFFDQNNVKSADEVTYDDDGNVVPLSERFNTDKTDIRWSKAQNLTEEQNETVQKAEENGIDIDVINHTASKYSRASFERSDYYTNPEEMARMLAKNVLGSESKANIAKAKKWIKDVTSISAMIAENSEVLDYVASPGRSSFKSNPEYGGSIDSSTICAKRILQTGTIDAIQRALPDYVMSAEDFLQIRRMMKERGYEVSCGLCFVESSRKNIAKYASQFMREWNSQHPDNKVDMTQINTVLGLEDTRLNNKEVYEAYEKFMNKLAQRKPKLFEMRSEYNNDIIKHFRNDSSVAEKNKNGGMRINSFSDFEVVHLIDMMQVIMDMANVGLSGQAYTKVKQFIQALGPTGLKINASMIAKGVDGNGRIIFDEVEGMKWDDVKDLRDMYADNVGTICVVFTEDQLKAAMADDRIDFIIPFHRSQWNKSNYKDIGLPDNTKDFTYWQNERYREPVYGLKKDGTKKKLRATNYKPNEYWKFNLNGKENAELYLQKCFKENKIPKFWKWLQSNGDGSFSLKEDGSTDGYWKLLGDFKMYNHLTNKGAPQMPVQPIFDMEASKEMLEEYKGGHNEFPVAEDVVNDFVNEKKNGRKGIARGKNGKIQLAGAEIENTRMSKSDDMEAMDAGTWIANLTPGSVQTADERDLIQAYKDKRISMSLCLKRQLDYKAKIKELEKKDSLSGEERDELENLHMKLEQQQERMEQLEKEMKQITSKEGYAGMMYRYNKVLQDFVQGRTSDQIMESVDSMVKEVNEAQAEIDKMRAEIKELENKPAVRAIRSDMAKSGQNQEIKDLISQFANGTLEQLSQKLESAIKAGYKAAEWSKILQNDVHTAIDYYNKVAAVAAKEEKTRVRKDLIEQLRSENAKKLYEMQDKYEQLLKDNRKARETAEENKTLRSKINTNISRLRKRLTEETDKQNIPEETKALARYLCGKLVNHDMTDGLRRVLLADKQQLTDFSERLKRMDAEDGGFDAERDLDWLVIKAPNAEDNDYTLRDKIAADLRSIDNGLLMYWTAEGNGLESLQNRRDALNEISEAVAEITSAIRARGQAFIANKRYELADLAERAEDEMTGSRFKGERYGRGSKAKDAIERGIGYGNLTPVYFFKNLKNSIFDLLHKGFNKAENDSGLMAADVQKRMEAIADETGFRNWDGQEKHKVKVNGGREIDMTTEQIMALYATWQREKNNLRPEQTAHLLKGGFVLAQEDRSKGKPGREKSNQRPMKMTREQLDSLGDMLTEQQKDFVNRIVEYMSTDLAEIANRTSMETYGIKKFTEKYYFPIKSWGGVLAQESNRGVRNNNENAAMRQSFTKRITAGAQNTIEIGDFTPTAMRHMAGMITFNTVGPAVENLNRVLNYNLQYGDITYGEGGEVEEDNRYKRSVRAAFQEAYGKNAADYLAQFMQDINGGTAQGIGNTVFDKLLSTFRKGAVAGSLSVAAQQPLSYIRAAMMINPKYMASAIAPWHWGRIHEEMTKYSGIAVIKDMGRFDMQLGRSMLDYITPDGKESGLKTAWTKFSDATTVLPEKMDAITWGRMWVASKMEMAAKNPHMDQTSDEFMQKVAERFNDVMRMTQVYDSVMVKSQNMRTKNPWIKSITSFMAEPTLSLNVLADAVRNAGEKGGKANIAKAGATFILSAVMQAMVKGVMSSGRSPDKKKTWEEQFLTRWFSNFLSEADPLSLIPGYSDLIELLKSGELSNDALGVIGKVKTITQTMVNAASGKGRGAWRDIEDTVGQVVQIFSSVPMRNIMRDVRAMYNFFNPETYAARAYSGNVTKYGIKDAFMTADNMVGVVNTYLQMAEAGYGTSNKDYIKRLYEAEKNNKTKLAADLTDYLLNAKVSDQKNKTKEAVINDEMKSLTKQDSTLSYMDRIKALKEKRGMKGSDVASWILSEYKDKKLTKKEAEALYVQANPDKTADDAYFKFEQADYEELNKVDLTESAYFRLNEALKKGDTRAVERATAELLEHGKKEEDVNSHKKTYVTDLYSKGKITRKQAEEQLKQWRPDLSANDIYWTLDLIDYKKETGNSDASGKAYRLKDAMEANKNEEIRAAIKAMTSHGVEVKSIKSTITSTWKDKYLAADRNGKIKIRDAIQKAYKAMGLTTADADKVINGWKKTKKTTKK